MKVDMKIVPSVRVRDGWLSNEKTFHQLLWKIKLTDVEKAIIEQAGLRDFAIYETVHHNDDHTYSEKLDFPISPWVDETVTDYGGCEFYTLIEAQAAGQELKANLVRLKEAMNQHTHIGTDTEDSFEL